MSRGAAICLAVVLVATGARSGHGGVPCPMPAGFVAEQQVASEEFVVLFRTVPPRIGAGQPFSVEAVACATPSGAAVSSLRVDARMSEPGQAPALRPRISALADGRWVAEGLRVPAPGRWQLLFEVERQGQTEQLTADLAVE